MPKKDLNQLAASIVAQATGETPLQNAARKLANRAAGQKGGKSRMQALTDDQRAELSLRGVVARKTPTPSKVGAAKIKKDNL